MINVIKNIIILKLKLMVKNPEYLIVVLMPIGFMLLYDQLWSSDQAYGFLLTMGLSFTFSMASGILVSTMIAEEKEKNTLKSLKLIGVKSRDYAIASLTIPTIINILAIIGFYWWFNGNELAATNLEYAVITFLTSLASTLLFFLFGLISKTQSQAMIFGLFGMIIVALLPLFGGANDTLETILDFSFMGSFSELLLNNAEGLLMNQAFFILLIWLVGLALINTYVYKKML